MTKIDSVSKIEMAKALKGIKSVVDNTTYDKIVEIALLNHNKQEVINSVEGLSEEDEFALLTKLMGQHYK